MATNNFKIFNNNVTTNELGTSNVMNDTTYASICARGLQVGDGASSAMFNKVLRQATMFSWALAELISSELSKDVTDADGDTIKTDLNSYLTKIIQGIAETTVSTVVNTLVKPSDIKLDNNIIKVGTNSIFDTSTKQDKLNESQLASLNSGITSAKITSYDALINNVNTFNQTLVSLQTSVSTLSETVSTNKTNTDTALNSKQATLNADQLKAVNSGITSTKVSTYDGYQTTISGMQESITSLTSALSNKQGTLTNAQLNAANSGITKAKVTKYDGYDTGKQDKLSDARINACDSGITADLVTFLINIRGNDDNYTKTFIDGWKVSVVSSGGSSGGGGDPLGPA